MTTKAHLHAAAVMNDWRDARDYISREVNAVCEYFSDDFFHDWAHNPDRRWATARYDERLRLIAKFVADATFVNAMELVNEHESAQAAKRAKADRRSVAEEAAFKQLTEAQLKDLAITIAESREMGYGDDSTHDALARTIADSGAAYDDEAQRLAYYIVHDRRCTIETETCFYIGHALGNGAFRCLTVPKD